MADLKKELEDAEDEKQKQDLVMIDVKDEKDPMDYFIDKYRPKDFDLVVKIYKENQVYIHFYCVSCLCKSSLILIDPFCI